MIPRFLILNQDGATCFMTIETLYLLLHFFLNKNLRLDLIRRVFFSQLMRNELSGNLDIFILMFLLIGLPDGFYLRQASLGIPLLLCDLAHIWLTL